MNPYSLKYLSKLLYADATRDALITSFSFDSREIKPGDLFFALKGAKTDGHHYLKEVANSGAFAAVVSKTYLGPDYGMALIPTDDPLTSLQTLASQMIKQRKSKIVSVTGSVGKTTTKDFIYSLLKTKYAVASTPGNANSQVGLPTAVLNHTNGDEDFLILEMGMTHPGEIAKLVSIAPPDIALITGIALSHACNFDCINDIAKTKGEIFLHPKTHLGIFPLDHEYKKIWDQVGSCKKSSFSLMYPHADYFLDERADGSLEIAIQEESITLPPFHLPGKHNLNNLLAALAVVKSLGMEWAEIKQAIKTLVLPKLRMEIVIKKGITFVNDSYNANSASVQAALEALPPPQQGGKRIAVLGEMLELGKFSEQCHREVGQYALNKVDRVLLFGDKCKPIADCWKAADKPSATFQTHDDLVASLRNVANEGDVVLLKGSQSKQMWKVLEKF